ncbi:unnamed protein product [Alternaria alternata]
MDSNSQGTSNSQKGPKVAIPRLKRAPSPPPPSKSSKRSREDRVNRACIACRKRKGKCSGEVPHCSYCQINSLDCVYEKAKKDRLREATQLNHTLATLLRDLSEHVDNVNKQKIDDALQGTADDLISLATSTSLNLGKRSRTSSTNESDDGEAHGEAFVTASVGSNEDLDHLDEDLMRDHESRATGYVGPNSEIHWLRSAQRQTENIGAEPYGQPHGPPGSTRNAANARSDALHDRQDNAKENSRQGSMKYMNDTTFYLDSDDIDIDIFVDPCEDPDPDVAERLFNCYLMTVHPFFPLATQTFADQFHKYLNVLRHSGACQVPPKWRVLMNLLLAIGAKYSHLVVAEWRGDDRDHLMYMTRAVHLLGLKNTGMIISAPDLQLVQATGALAFYFLAIGHVSRAWIMIGVSIRLALALGLHLRNEDPGAEESKKESLVRTWWSLQSTECLVSAITGRPPVVAFEDCTVSLPRSLAGERVDAKDSSRKLAGRDAGCNSPQTTRDSRTSESGQRDLGRDHYLINHVNITIISQKALLKLYSPRTAARSWESVQGSILGLLNELEEWSEAALLKGRRAAKKEHVMGIEREQFLLKAEYLSTRILVTRPCLCRIERRIRDESNASAKFNRTSAEACVRAALEMTQLFPDEPDLDFIYSKGPWWAIVHLIMQSIAVLILEMTYRKRGTENSEPSMVVSIRKMIRWLRAMRNNDPVAARAHHVIKEILKRCAPALQSQADELLALYEEGTPEPDAYQHHHMPYNARQTVQVPRDNFQLHSMDTGSTFDSQPSQNYPLGNLPGYRNDFDPFYLPEEHIAPMPFGNPFFTDFDHGVPSIDMQGLWNQPGYSNPFDPSLSHVNTLQDSHGGEHRSNVKFPPEQQQEEEDYDLSRE